MFEDNVRKHTVARSEKKRALRVIASASITFLIAAGLIYGDITDVTPGILTLTPQKSYTPPVARHSVASQSQLSNLPQDAHADATQVNQAIAPLLELPADVSVSVTNLDGSVIAEHSATVPREPASTTKTLTALAASQVLDLNATLQTQTLLSKDNTTLLLRGQGDMLLGRGQSDPSHINGRAGLQTLAEQTAKALQLRGISHIALCYDTSLFGSNREPKTIEVNNPEHRYYTNISAFAVDGGRKYEGGIPSNPDGSNGYPILVENAEEDAAQTFADVLTSQGIRIDGDIAEDDSGTQVESQHGALTALASVESAPLREIMAFTLRHSDNTLAEELGRLVALAKGYENTPEGASKAVLDTLSENGIDTKGAVLADCSGLSAGTRLTTKLLNQVQLTAVQKAGNASAVITGASIPGLVGTARNRLTDADAAGHLRVKTGSLDQTSAMSGIAVGDKGALTFAIVVNNPENMTEAIETINAAVSALAEVNYGI